MLQQTQVRTVIDYFNRFLERFPSIRHLAAADESEVLALWEGLGYYRRARSLHAAARVICEKHGGKFPVEFDQVLALPGIGRYTAGAIQSIARNEPFPILEGNTVRLHSRLLGLNADPVSPVANKLLWRFAEDILPARQSRLKPRELNQALMEIGGEICKPSRPDCQVCPLASRCVARQHRLQDCIPVAGKRTQYEDRRFALFLCENRAGEFLVRKRQANEWWSGLWDFVRLELPAVNMVGGNAGSNPGKGIQVFKNLAKTIRSVLKNGGSSDAFTSGQYRSSPKIMETDLDSLEPDLTLKHAVTRYRIELNCFHLREFGCDHPGPYSWVGADAICQLPLNVTARRAFDRLIEDNV